MRSIRALAGLLVLFCIEAQAMSIDAKAMARFDISYVKCEAKYPQMRGARDEAYLSLWRVKPDDKARAELAAVRKSPAYLAEHKRVRAEQAKPDAKADATTALPNNTLEQQCQALWSETQRVRSIAQ